MSFALAEKVSRTPKQTRSEIRKLQSVGVLAEVDRVRKTEIYGVAEGEVAERVLSLPAVLVKRLGPYQRT
jgi:hypothetical protein